MSRASSGVVVDVSLLEVGDVVLSRGSAIQSLAIAKATGGRFSHAAIMLTPTLLLESTGAGVTLSRPPLVACDLPGGGTVHGHAHAGDVAVYRPDWGAARMPEEERLAGLVGEALWQVGRSYSAAHRLLAVSDGFWAANPGGIADKFVAAARHALRERAAAAQPPMMTEGPFCSELVDLMLATARGGTPHGLRSPNALASDGTLRDLPGVVAEGTLRAPDPAIAALYASADAVFAGYDHDAARKVGWLITKIRLLVGGLGLAGDQRARLAAAALLEDSVDRLATRCVGSVLAVRAAEGPLLGALAATPPAGTAATARAPTAR